MATRQMLSRATEGTQAPTPGYLYKDLTVAAQTNPTVCQEMAQYLTQRLQKANPNIKYKSLKLIAKIADQVPHFKRCLSQSPHGVSEIKAHIGYRGPLDPVRGDEPNAKVRQAAQEALDAVYREAPTASMAAMSNPYGSSSSSSAHAHSRRMDGVGNPRYSDPRLDPRYNGTQPTTIGEAVREAGEVVIGMIKDPLARNIEIAPSVGGVVGIGGGASAVPSRGFGELPQYSHSRPPPGAAELSRQTQGQWTMASNRGPNAVAPPPSAYQREADYYPNSSNSNSQTRASSGTVGGSWGSAPAPPMTTGGGGGGNSGGGYGHGHSTTPSIHITPHPSAPPPSSVPSARADGSYERNLILELCPPSGLKAVPPPDKLAQFSKLVPSLNPDFVCPALLDCLEEGQPWIIRAKALCVMETTLYSGAQASGHNPYRDFFHACQEEILPMAGHPRPAISGPAKRVLAILGVDSGVVDSAVSHAHQHPHPHAPHSSSSAAAAPNLLDFDDDNAGPAVAVAAAPSSASSPALVTNGGESLFGGMQVKASAANGGAQPSSAVDFGAGGTGKAYDPSPAAPNLLDGFVGDSPASANPAASQAIFRPSDAATSTTASMFGQMTLKSTQEDKKTDSEDGGDVAAPSANGSAFGFINSTSSKDSSATATGAAAASSSAPPPPPPTAASFDPLKNFSPNSSKKTMTVSPEQMQAMAYQQMMMQQQQIQLQRMMMQQQGMVFTPGVVGAVPVMPVGAVPVLPGMPPMAGGGHHMAGLFKAPSAASAGAPQAGKDDKKFDFVKDAMHTAGKK